MTLRYPTVSAASGADARTHSGKQDTFREAGRGFGATYRILWPLLRIDYVFVPENADVLEHRTLRRDYSDHYPVITEINMNEKCKNNDTERTD